MKDQLFILLVPMRKVEGFTLAILMEPVAR